MSKTPEPERGEPVKTVYPGRPPASLPDHLHYDWIQTTAAGLDAWHVMIKRRETLRNWMEQAGRKWIDDHPADHELRQLQHEMNRLWNEVVPLFGEVMAHFPRRVWTKFKHIRTPHEAEKEPAKAVEEWQHVRDHANDRNAKLCRKLECAAGEANETAARIEKEAKIGLGNPPPPAWPKDDQGGETHSKQDKALLKLLAHPEWTDTKIATEIGISRTTLYTWPKFKAARKAQIDSNLATDPARRRNPRKSARLAGEKHDNRDE